jgi:hypothetical protein
VGERLEALLIPNKAPVITDLNQMGHPVILAYKSAAWLEGGTYHIAPGGTLKPTIQTLGISTDSINLISMALNLHHQGLT